MFFSCSDLVFTHISYVHSIIQKSLSLLITVTPLKSQFQASQITTYFLFSWYPIPPYQEYFDPTGTHNLLTTFSVSLKDLSKLFPYILKYLASFLVHFKYLTKWKTLLILTLFSQLIYFCSWMWTDNQNHADWPINFTY